MSYAICRNCNETLWLVRVRNKPSYYVHLMPAGKVAKCNKPELG